MAKMIFEKWNPRFSLRYLPDNIRKKFILHAELLLENLATMQQEKILVEPLPENKRFEGHKVLRTCNKPPGWYMQMYRSRCPNHRRYRTIKALQRIIDYRDGSHGIRRFVYDYVIREVIFERLKNGFVDPLTKIDSDSEVLEYFDIEPDEKLEWGERDWFDSDNVIIFDFELEEAPF